MRLHLTILLRLNFSLMRHKPTEERWNNQKHSNNFQIHIWNKFLFLKQKKIIRCCFIFGKLRNIIFEPPQLLWTKNFSQFFILNYSAVLCLWFYFLSTMSVNKGVQWLFAVNWFHSTALHRTINFYHYFNSDSCHPFADRLYKLFKSQFIFALKMKKCRERKIFNHIFARDTFLNF
jgi:hypothetical protein